ncbi:uncharacterized protein LOC111124355 isoform X2 [Crassostrea virginica]
MLKHVRSEKKLSDGVVGAIRLILYGYIKQHEMNKQTQRAKYLYTRPGELPRIHERTQKKLITRRSSECLVRSLTELSVRPNTAHPELANDHKRFLRLSNAVNLAAKLRRKSRARNDENSDDSDCETVLGEDKIKTQIFNPNQKIQYRNLCEEIGIIPSSSFIRQINESQANLSYNQLTPLDIRAISAVLINNTKITSINVSNNNLGRTGTLHLSQVLAENVFINKLEMSSVDMEEEGLRALLATLLDNKVLVYLDISRNNIGYKCAEDLARLIKTNDFIEHLDLSGNLIDDYTGSIIGPAIASNLTLKSLDLSWNQIRRAGAASLAESICKNIELEHVNLSWNGLAEHGCRAFQEHLPKNHTLKSLDISNNRIGFHTLGHFLIGLKGNDTLKYLKIQGNPITTEGVKAILAVIEESDWCRLEELNIQDLPIDSFVKSEAWRLMEKMKMRITHPELLMKPAINMKQPITNMKQPLSLDDDYPALTLIEPQINFQPVDLPVFQFFEKIATHSGLQTNNAKTVDHVLNMLEKNNTAIECLKMLKDKRYTGLFRQTPSDVENSTLDAIVEKLEEFLKKQGVQSRAATSDSRRPLRLPSLTSSRNYPSTV